MPIISSITLNQDIECNRHTASCDRSTCILKSGTSYPVQESNLRFVNESPRLSLIVYKESCSNIASGCSNNNFFIEDLKKLFEGLDSPVYYHNTEFSMLGNQLASR